VKFKLLFLTLAMLPLMAQEPTPAPAPPPTLGDAAHPAIAILPLKGHADPQFGANSGDAVYQKVTQSFFKTKRFTMVERAQMAAVLGEGRLQNSDAIDDNTAVSMGKQMGVKFLILGSYSTTIAHTRDELRDKRGNVSIVEGWPATMVVNLRMVDVQTGKIVELIDGKGSANGSDPSHSVSTTMDDLTKKLDREVSNHYPMTGYVIKVMDEKKAMIDIGKQDGLNVDDILNVIQRGEDIVHPVTGKVIKGEKRIVTQFKVISVDDESAIVKISGDMVPIKPGMALESAPKKKGFFESVNDFMK
jgi:hypothetical protein